RRICRLARHAGDRRLRSPHLRDPRLSGRARTPAAAGHERLRGLEKTALMPAAAPGLVSVAARELRRVWGGRAALFLAVGVPLLAFAVLSLTFSNAVVRDLRVDVVDRDLTQTSMIYVQAVNAAPGLNVTRRSTDLNAAMHAIRSGAAIPPGYI